MQSATAYNQSRLSNPALTPQPTSATKLWQQLTLVLPDSHTVLCFFCVRKDLLSNSTAGEMKATRDEATPPKSESLDGRAGTQTPPAVSATGLCLRLSDSAACPPGVNAMTAFSIMMPTLCIRISPDRLQLFRSPAQLCNALSLTDATLTAG